MALVNFVSRVTVIAAAWLNKLDYSTQQRVLNHGTDSGVANTYAVAVSGLGVDLLTITGTLLRFKPLVTNTGPATLNASNIINELGNALTGGEVNSLGITTVRYSGTAWQLVNPDITADKARTAAEIAALIVPTNYSVPPNNIESGDISRYGLVDITGATDSSSAINTSLALNNVVVFPEGNIRWDTPPTLGTQTNIYLRGKGSQKTNLWVKNQTAYTFILTNATTPLFWRADAMTVDGSNGGGSANGSTTWPGFFSCTNTAGPVSNVWTDDLRVINSKVASAILMNFGTAIGVETNRSEFASPINGFGFQHGGASTTTTAVHNNLRVNTCRQAYLIGSNVSDVTFNEGYIQSCNVAGHTLLALVTFNNTYFENIGIQNGTSAKGISFMSGSLTFGNLLDSTLCDAAFTQVYGMHVFNNCRFARLATAGTATAWHQPIGFGSSVGGYGSLVVHGGSNSETTGTFFRAEKVAGERTGFDLVVNDYYPYPVGNSGVLRFVSDARLCTSGFYAVQTNTAGIRLAIIRRGQFTYGLDNISTYTGGLTDYPAGSTNNVGDEVLITAPTAGQPTRYKCTVQGPPGTWQPLNVITGVSTTAPVIVNGDTIVTAGVTQARIAPAGAVTGLILANGTFQGQKITIINESTGANTGTFAVAGTSHVADGVTSVLAGLRSMLLEWDTTTSLWYRS